MDTTSLIQIAIVVVLVYLFIKFIVSPVIKIIVGIIIFIVLFSLLQKFFGFNIDQVLAPFGISLNITKWVSNFNWITDPADYFVNQIKDFAGSILDNIPKK